MKTLPKNAIGEWRLPGECLACDAENSYERKLVESEKSLRGETFTVKHHSWRCRECGEGLLGPTEMDEAMRAVVEAYQKAHGLLTAENLKKLRSQQKLSQAKLAELSGLGIASIKRWEGGLVLQTEANDEALRGVLENRKEEKDDPFIFVEKRLSLIGINQKYFRTVIMPSCFTRNSVASSQGLIKMISWIVQRTGVSPNSLFDLSAEPRLAVSVGARYKKPKNKAVDDLQLCEAICGQFGTFIAGILNGAERRALPPAEELREALVNGSSGPGVSFSSAVQACWDHGIAVVHISNFPNGCKKPDAMAMLVEDRPVIVITKVRHSAAWMIFYLIHEMGHFHHGHVSGSEPRIDEKVNFAEAEDPEEREANHYAAEVILGCPRVIWPKARFTGETLAKSSKEIGKKFGIAPSALVLSYAYQEGEWGLGNQALQILEKTEPDPIVTINRIARDRLDWTDVSEENREWFALMTGLDDDA